MALILGALSAFVEGGLISDALAGEITDSPTSWLRPSAFSRHGRGSGHPTDGDAMWRLPACQGAPSQDRRDESATVV